MRLAVLLVLCIGGMKAGAVELIVDTQAPVLEKPAGISVVIDDEAKQLPAAGWTVVARYYPNSTLERSETVGVTDSSGKVTWIPAAPGIVSISAVRGDETITHAVSVMYPGLPGGAALVFIVAGSILLGGAGWSLIRLVEHDPRHGRLT